MKILKQLIAFVGFFPYLILLILRYGITDKKVDKKLQQFSNWSDE